MRHTMRLQRTGVRCKRFPRFPSPIVGHRSYHVARATTDASDVVGSVCDLRSDTVTRPSPGMRNAMAGAEVGDVVWGDDPSVTALEHRFAQLCGGASLRALFVPTGTMANQLALMTHALHNPLQRVSQAVIADHRSHIAASELGGAARLSGVDVIRVNTQHYAAAAAAATTTTERIADETYDVAVNAHLTADMVHSVTYLEEDLHSPSTTMVAVEDTMAGQVHPLASQMQIRKHVTRHGMLSHLDGARLWNAAVHGHHRDFQPWASTYDSMYVCFSKGLGAPVGACLVGDERFIHVARQYCKMLGGGWRQAGVLAAAADWAITHNWQRMKEDHEKAEYLAQELVQLGFKVVPPMTNVVTSTTKNSSIPISWTAVVQRVQERVPNAFLLAPDAHDCRLVTHLDVTMDQLRNFVRVLKQVLQ